MRDLSKVKFKDGRPYIEVIDKRYSVPSKRYGQIKYCKLCGEKFFADPANPGIYCSWKCNHNSFKERVGVKHHG